MNLKKDKVTAIILAAGSGSRMNMNCTKQKLNIRGKTLIKRCVEVFDKSFMVDSIIVVCKEDEKDFIKNEVSEFRKVISFINGGKCRAESAKAGFEQIPTDTDFVLIHDAARCLITESEIENVILGAIKNGAATASVPVVDTIKKCSPDGVVLETLDRSSLMSIQTPQVFSVDIYRKALEASSELTSSITDDNMLVEAIGVKVHCVKTLPTNIKITTENDLYTAEFIIAKREEEDTL